MLPLLFETFLTPILWEIQHVLAMMCLHVNWTAHMARNCVIETEGLFKVTGSHILVHYESDVILRSVQDRDFVTTGSDTRPIESHYFR